MPAIGLRGVEKRAGEVAVDTGPGTASPPGQSRFAVSSMRILVRMKIVRSAAGQHHQDDERRHQRELDRRHAAPRPRQTGQFYGKGSLSTVTCTVWIICRLSGDRRRDRRQVRLGIGDCVLNDLARGAWPGRRIDVGRVVGDGGVTFA